MTSLPTVLRDKDGADRSSIATSSLRKPEYWVASIQAVPSFRRATPKSSSIDGRAPSCGNRLDNTGDGM
jgi:hypothetical protein